MGRGGEDIAVAWAGLLIGSLLAALLARPMDLLFLGREAATALGASRGGFGWGSWRWWRSWRVPPPRPWGR
ncbi:hypothetical protein H7347_00135 [Corynebacterium sp. zg-331]|uniref:hypothetical protein n=1 Tax=unclassified Corynebacterium TaxID=2624378 RepID=UPI00128DABEF|nr:MULTISPECIES: hypothetical protein [unclassified Corynebacterium]MBC3185006.1 hypothetical protein [Corynebacterium sp. zg-331]MPV51507.1 hypothetical protein [Corynebacterium sp. zg331]